jgi:Uma2 family endonuclease
MARGTPQIHIDGDRIRVPATSLRHSGFRDWLKSDELPEGGRATFASGQVFLEMSPESTETHNKVKTAVTVGLALLVQAEQLGEAYSDGTLLTHVGAAVSTEPDFVFASWEAFESGRLRLIEKANRSDDYIELEGTPDLIVEIVSDSSETKDLVTLREHYYAAGVPEYWIIDARSDAVRFRILSRTEEGYVAVAEATQSQPSRVLGRTFRIERTRNRAGRWEYRLIAE